MTTRTQIDLPAQVGRPFEVFVNGVPQKEGEDFDLIGASLVFNRPLAREGNIGWWRWARMLLGIAGTYRKNDTVDVVYTASNGRRQVASLAPRATADEKQ